MRPLVLIGALLLLASCHSVDPGVHPAAAAPSIRLLLTFDDGPSIRSDYNPTLAIVRQLASNDVQPGIKALFFVQTEHKKGGGTPRGREIMREIHAQGHVLGIHSTSPGGHIAHTTLPTGVLTAELRQACELIQRLTGSAPCFIRPPYGACDERTRTIYNEFGLSVLMGDVRARDGLIYGFKASPWRRFHLYHSLKALRRQATPGAVSTIIVEFHDVNPYTARHMTEYLHLLVEEARAAGFTFPERPFLDRADAITTLAIDRRVPPPPAGQGRGSLTAIKPALGSGG
jgi:peptidoglycan/xylan/chitin deacetylase (PgdA/CDA1 family)